MMDPSNCIYSSHIEKLSDMYDNDHWNNDWNNTSSVNSVKCYKVIIVRINNVCYPTPRTLANKRACESHVTLPCLVNHTYNLIGPIHDKSYTIKATRKFLRIRGNNK